MCCFAKWFHIQSFAVCLVIHCGKMTLWCLLIFGIRRCFAFFKAFLGLSHFFGRTLWKTYIGSKRFWDFEIFSEICEVNLWLSSFWSKPHSDSGIKRKEKTSCRFPRTSLNMHVMYGFLLVTHRETTFVLETSLESHLLWHLWAVKGKGHPIDVRRRPWGRPKYTPFYWSHK